MNGMFSSLISLPHPFFEAEDGGGSGGEGGGSEDTDEHKDGKDAATLEFEAWLAKQPKATQDGYNAMTPEAQTFFREHTAGLKSALDKERELSKTAKKQLKQFQDNEDKRKKDSMSELDRTKAELEESRAKVTATQTELEKVRIESKVVAEAAMLHFTNPEDAIQLLDRSKITVQEDGTVVGAAEALKELAKAKPYLIEKDSGDRIGNDTRKGNKKGNKGNEPLPEVRINF